MIERTLKGGVWLTAALCLAASGALAQGPGVPVDKAAEPEVLEAREAAPREEAAPKGQAAAPETEPEAREEAAPQEDAAAGNAAEMEEVDLGALPVLDLATAQRRALADNPSIKAVVELAAQARQVVRQALSGYLPNMTATYTATETRLSRDDIRGLRNQARSQAALTGQDEDDLLDEVENEVERHNLSLQAQYRLFDGFFREATHAAARAGYKQTKAGLREARRLLLQGVANAYYGIQLARENIAIAEADVAFNERLLKEAKARRRVGTGSLSDVLNFEVQVRAARSNQLDARNQYDIARVALAILMGISSGELPKDARIADLPLESPETLAQPDDASLIDLALNTRPDLIQSDYGVDRAKAGLRQQAAEFFPTVDLFVQREATRDDNHDFGGDDYADTIGVQVNYDIFTGGRRVARVLEAKHAKREAEYRRRETELQVVEEVRRALLDLRRAQEDLVLQRTTSEYVERNRDLVEKEYDAGQGALARLNQAQRDLVAAQGRLALARVTLEQAWFSLRTATGQVLLDFEEAPRDGAGEDEPDSEDAALEQDDLGM